MRRRRWSQAVILLVLAAVSLVIYVVVTDENFCLPIGLNCLDR